MTSALLMIKEVVSSMNGCVLKKGTVPPSTILQRWQQRT